MFVWYANSYQITQCVRAYSPFIFLPCIWNKTFNLSMLFVFHSSDLRVLRPSYFVNSEKRPEVHSCWQLHSNILKCPLTFSSIRGVQPGYGASTLTGKSKWKTSESGSKLFSFLPVCLLRPNEISGSREGCTELGRSKVKVLIRRVPQGPNSSLNQKLASTSDWIKLIRSEQGSYRLLI